MNSVELKRGLQSFQDVAGEINTNVWSFWRLSSRMEPPPTDLSGNHYIVTGGNRGFGRGVTLELVARNASVIIGARGAAAAANVINECSKLNPKAPKVTYFPLDLSSFASIDSFARNVQDMIGAKGGGLNGLVNNAALWMSQQKWTVGANQPEMELTWAVNMFGLSYLTAKMMDLLRMASIGDGRGAKIINVSSLAHLNVPAVDVCDPMARKRTFNWINNYAETKLALMFYTKQLAKQLAPTGIQVYGVDPGISQTELGANFGTVARWAMNLVVMRPLTRAPIDGSRSILFPLLFDRQTYDVKKWYTW